MMLISKFPFIVTFAAPWQILQKGWKEINCVCFSPCGSQIATGNDLCEVHLWDMNAIKVVVCKFIMFYDSMNVQ